MDATLAPPLEQIEELTIVDERVVFLNDQGEVLETTDAHTFLMGGGSTGDPIEDAPWPEDTPWYSKY
jgi:hypothetical protein